MKLKQITLYTGGSIFGLSLVVMVFLLNINAGDPAILPENVPLLGLAPPALSSSQIQHHSSVSSPGQSQQVGLKTSSEADYGGLDENTINKNLAAIKLNRDGSLVLGTQHKKQLEAAFKRMDYNMSEKQLENLQDYIKAGLGGEIGETVASVVKNYYDFKVAEKDLMQQMNDTDFDSLQSNFEQIVQMRIAHLGPEINEQLFGKEQRQEQYMIESMRLQNDASLSRQERNRMQKELTDRFRFDIY